MMLKVNPSYKNLSNCFTDTDDVSSSLQRIIPEVTDTLFGLEIEMTPGVVRKSLITPPHIRLSEHTRKHREASTDGFTFYEGYLSRPHFLPLYGALRGQFIRDIEEISLYGEERVYIQWLFRKKYNWKEKALDMYRSYLEGNEYPSSSKIGRVLQEKTLSVLNRIASFSPSPEYIEEVEEKLLSDGFQFQLRVAMQTSREEVIKSSILNALTQYDAYNSIRLFKQTHNKAVEHFESCVLTSDTSEQIISTQELFSLLGGETQSIPSIEVAATKPIGGAIDLLPKYTRENVVADETLIGRIAESLKRVGLIDKARIYNESMTAGIRLTVVQCDIPKGKNLTHITQKSKDIQAALGVPSLGVEQGETADTVKFVIPNEEPAVICLREIIEQSDFIKYKKENPLAFAAGVDEVNNPIYLSLAKLVHLLVAGTTGSGKSVFINSLVTTLLVNYTPEELRMVMIDPKMVELQQYKDFPHVNKVVTEMQEAGRELERLVVEMENRYQQFKDAGVKNIQLYNKKSPDKMPYTVCVIDEYADLKDTNKEVEEYIARLGQKARAAGIHLVLATQRPSADIVSGRIKANIPNAISFNLNNNTNYKTVFGSGISYKLLGKGDGVMKIEGYPKEFQRFQSAIISPDETKEAEVYKNLSEYYSGKFPKVVEPEIVEEESEDNEELNKLKQVIADTGETRVEHLRKELGVKTTKMKDLMGALVEEGWLIKHKERSKGYELVAEDSVLSEWKTS